MKYSSFIIGRILAQSVDHPGGAFSLASPRARLWSPARRPARSTNALDEP